MANLAMLLTYKCPWNYSLWFILFSFMFDTLLASIPPQSPAYANTNPCASHPKPSKSNDAHTVHPNHPKECLSFEILAFTAPFRIRIVQVRNDVLFPISMLYSNASSRSFSSLLLPAISMFNPLRPSLH
ncbi:hypothetical protein L208DRAFT_1394581 [Tricholoma matsutake]|nr:hypothetical protein L208DRAFT_1394581 [Tricholoma matsutake 945]